ncbi:hypothetical protein OQA88_10464 [Cercophora sp. LCS_1]
MSDMHLQRTAEEPIALLPLMPPRPPNTHLKPDLEVIVANNHVIRVVDPTASPIRVMERHFNHASHRFVLNYAVARASTGWTVSVYDAAGSLIVGYTFAIKLAALKFQEYISGYKAFAYVEQISCSAIFKARLLEKGEFKSPRYYGNGEIQIWIPEDLVDGPLASPPASLYRTSTSSTILSGPGSFFKAKSASPGASGSSDRDTFVNHNRSPLLFAFFRDEGGYTMLRARVVDLSWSLTRKGDTDALIFSSSAGKDQGFKAYKYTKPTARISEWDVGVMARNLTSRAAEEITIMNLTLKTRAVSSVADETEDKLRYLQRQLDEVYKTYTKAQASKFQIPEMIKQGIDPSKGYNELLGAQATSPRHSMVSQPGTLSGFSYPQELYGEYTRTDGRQYTHMEQTILFQAPNQQPRSTEGSSAGPPSSVPGVPETLNTPVQQAEDNHQPIDTPESSDDEESSLFGEFDQRVEQAISNHPDLGPPDRAIRALHSLPGEMRALLYQFPAGDTEESHRGSKGLFRCPFNILNPRVHRKGECKGPGFPLPELSEHIEEKHLSYECKTCKRVFNDEPELDAHIKTTCEPSTNLPNGVPFHKINHVRQALKTPKKKEKATTEEERWYMMWDMLFPGVNRPSPYFAVPRKTQDDAEGLRLEILFAAMIDSDNTQGSKVVDKDKARLYLRAAMQALLRGEPPGSEEASMGGERGSRVSDGDGAS